MSPPPIQQQTQQGFNMNCAIYPDSNMYNNAYPPADMGNYMQNHAYPSYDYPPPTGPGFNAYAGQLPNVMQPNPPGLYLWIHSGGVEIN